MESIYQVKGSPAESQYHGCGRAWVAIKDGQTVAIRYMNGGDDGPAVNALEEWVKVVKPWELPTVWEHGSWFLDWPCISAAKLGAAKKAAIAAGHPAMGPRGGYIPARRIVSAAWSLYERAERADFGAYRATVRAELETMGEVVSGMLSCYEFLPKH